jgi:hypothetical protein
MLGFAALTQTRTPFGASALFSNQHREKAWPGTAYLRIFLFILTDLPGFSWRAWRLGEKTSSFFVFFVRFVVTRNFRARGVASGNGLPSHSTG